MTSPLYLGDGCYAHIDAAGRVVLTTGHHEPAEADNTMRAKDNGQHVAASKAIGWDK